MIKHQVCVELVILRAVPSYLLTPEWFHYLCLGKILLPRFHGLVLAASTRIDA